MIDENAFGLLISYYSIEDDEYGLEPAEFVRRFGEFRELVLGVVRDHAPGRDVRALDLGHALYFELADGDQHGDPIAWLRQVRARLGECDFESVCVLSHGGRWIAESEPEPARAEPIGGDVLLCRASLPSEPLRRSLYADAASRLDEDSDFEGWGPGVYVDSEAVEALGRTPKNAPTPLCTAGAVFYRVGG
jgi:hypothetical protein